MWVADKWKDYKIVDTSDGEKLEYFGKYSLIRPDPQVIWKTEKTHPLWKLADASYKRSKWKCSSLRLRLRILCLHDKPKKRSEKYNNN
jgi:23S rRNA (cytosine1962-C5)-methyltransferase